MHDGDHRDRIDRRDHRERTGVGGAMTVERPRGIQRRVAVTADDAVAGRRAVVRPDAFRSGLRKFAF